MTNNEIAMRNANYQLSKYFTTQMQKLNKVRLSWYIDFIPKIYLRSCPPDLLLDFTVTQFQLFSHDKKLKFFH